MINWLADIIAKRCFDMFHEEHMDALQDKNKIKDAIKDIENRLKHLETQGELTSFTCVRIEHAIEDLKKNMKPKPQKKASENKLPPTLRIQELD